MPISPILLLVPDSPEERTAAVKALQPGDTMVIIGHLALFPVYDMLEAFVATHPNVDVMYEFQKDDKYCLVVRKLTHVGRRRLR